MNLKTTPSQKSKLNSRYILQIKDQKPQNTKPQSVVEHSTPLTKNLVFNGLKITTYQSDTLRSPKSSINLPFSPSKSRKQSDVSFINRPLTQRRHSSFNPNNMAIDVVNTVISHKSNGSLNSKKKDSELDCSTDYVKNRNINNDTDQYNSLPSGINSYDLDKYNLRHNYISESGRHDSPISKISEIVSPPLSQHKIKLETPSQGINSKYFSAVVDNRGRSPINDRNNIPLVRRVLNQKKVLNSIRKNLKPQNQLRPIVENPKLKSIDKRLYSPIISQKPQRPIQKPITDSRKRNPSESINKIINKDSILDKKRTKSECYSLNQKSHPSERTFPDIIIYIYAKKKLYLNLSPQKQLLRNMDQ